MRDAPVVTTDVLSFAEPAELGLTTFEVDKEILLLSERGNELVRLNATAASMWRQLCAGRSPEEISVSLAARLHADADEVRKDCESLIRHLSNLSRGSDTSDGTQQPPALGSVRGNSDVYASRGRKTPPQVSSYRLLDLEFTVRSAKRSNADLIRNLFGHLGDGGSRRRTTVEFEIDGLTLLENGSPVGQAGTSNGIPSLLHAHVLRAAYQHSQCMAAVHAAAVSVSKSYVLMPGLSGVGKSTLTAALISAGFDYGSDDLVLLTQTPIQLRPIPMRIGLKSGAWPILATLCPQLETLPNHQRSDGKLIKYFLPENAAIPSLEDGTLEACCVIFPTYRAGRTELSELGTLDALSRLSLTGYDLRGRMNAALVRSLLDWLAEVPRYELRYQDLNEAIETIRDTVS